MPEFHHLFRSLDPVTVQEVAGDATVLFQVLDRNGIKVFSIDKTPVLFNVKDFGAVGNGLTNDTAAIQAAVTAAGLSGGVVSLPPGTYLLTSQITFASPKVKMVGAGASLTILKRVATYGTVIGVSGDSVELEAFTIDGGYSTYPTGANHGVSVQSVNHFRARRLTVTNHLNTAILCQGTPNSTYRNNVIEDCLCDGLTVANNGFLIGDLDESGIRGSLARNIQGGSGPGYGIQLKNGCRYCFIDDCVAINCTGGLTFGRDSSPGVSYSRIVGSHAYNCDGGMLVGDGVNNVFSGIMIFQGTNVNDAIRFQQTSTGNVVSGVGVHGTGASRAAVRFDDTSTDNMVTLDIVNAACAAVASFNGTADRNLVELKKIGLAVPGNEIANTSSGVVNRFRRVEDRQTLFGLGLGEIAETNPRSLAASATQPTSQTAYYLPVYLQAGEVISSVTFHVSAYTSISTNFFVGLYSSGGLQRAVSADSAASVASTGQKTISFTTPFVVLNSGVHFIAILNNAGVFTLLRGASSTAGKIGTGSFPYAQDSSAVLNALPSPGTLVAGTIGFWAAVS